MSSADDSDEEGSLKDFIVKEESESEDSYESSESEDSSSSEEDSTDFDEEKPAAVETEEPVSKRQKTEEDPEVLKLLKEESEQFSKSIKGSIINGRVLRSREPACIEARRAKDYYYERFGRAEEEKLMEKFNKKDTIDFISKLEKDHKTAYEEAGNVWPVLNTRMKMEQIREAYDLLKTFLNLPESDAEDDDSDSIDDDETDDDDEEESDE